MVVVLFVLLFLVVLFTMLGCASDLDKMENRPTEERILNIDELMPATTRESIQVHFMPTTR